MRCSILGPILGLALLLLTNACSRDEASRLAQLHVVIDADPALRARIDRVVLKTETGAQTFLIDGPRGDARSVRWPFLAATISANPEKTRGILTVQGFAGDSELVRNTAEIQLDDRGAPVWGVYLTEACIDVFKTCDAEGEGTCTPCTGVCGGTSISLTALQRVESAQDALATWNMPSCDIGAPTDAGMDASVNTEAGLDGAMPTDAETDANTDAEAGSASGLTISGPSVAAAPGCVPFTIARSDASSAATLELTDQPRARFFADASCAQPAPTEFAAGQGDLSVWIATALVADELVANIEIAATSGQTSATRPLQLRMRARQVIRGEDLACVLLENDRVDCMGLSSKGRLGRPSTQQSQQLPLAATSIGNLFPKYSRLTSRDYFSCGIVRDSVSDTEGPVYCWGGNDYGQLANGVEPSDLPLAPQNLSGDFVTLTTGIRHACAINAASELWCWGDNTARQIVDDNDTRQPAARMSLLDGITGFVPKAVVAGYDFTCALSVAGDVYCWGNGYGTSAVKIDFPGAAKIKGLGGASMTTCAVTTDEKIYCFYSTATPSQVTGIPNGLPIDELQGSFQNNCARVGNDLYCWGKNPQGWLGTDSTAGTLSTARRVLLPAGKLESFALSGYDVTALSAVIDGLVYSWGFALGDNGSGSLGIELGLADVVRPARATKLDFAEQITTNAFSGGCGIGAGGAASCWGRSYWIGNGSSSVAEGGYTDLPLALSALNGATTAIEFNSAAAVALKDAKVFSWGYPTLGALGNSDANEASLASPEQLVFDVAGNALAIGASEYRGCVLLETATNARRIYCWGNFAPGEPPAERSKPFLVMTGDATLTDVDVSFDRACALVGGAVQCWNNKPATPAVLAGLESGVSALEMGTRSMCALKSNGDVLCAFAEGALATAFTKAASVRAGADHACALRTASEGGALFCAGSNARGQLGSGAVGAGIGVNEVTGLNGPITTYAAGHENSCAKDADGWKCWGDNRANALLLSPGVITQPTLIAPWQP